MEASAGERHHDGPVVVGVDGSDSSKAALSWAARYASLARLPLSVLLAWHLPTVYGWSPPFPEDWNPEADALATLELEVKEVLGPDYPPSVRLDVAEGFPASVLLKASESAALVVVGSRGRGEFTGMLLGSVSEFLVTHAHCPVVVVRDLAVNDAA